MAKLSIKDQVLVLSDEPDVSYGCSVAVRISCSNEFQIVVSYSGNNLVRGKIYVIVSRSNMCNKSAIPIDKELTCGVRHSGLSSIIKSQVEST